MAGFRQAYRDNRATTGVRKSYSVAGEVVGNDRGRNDRVETAFDRVNVFFLRKLQFDRV